MNIPLFSPIEAYQLNCLIAEAAAEPDVHEQLLNHDTQLIERFNLPKHLWQILSSIHAHSLQDFCKQLMHREQVN